MDNVSIFLWIVGAVFGLLISIGCIIYTAITNKPVFHTDEKSPPDWFWIIIIWIVCFSPLGMMAGVVFSFIFAIILFFALGWLLFQSINLPIRGIVWLIKREYVVSYENSNAVRLEEKILQGEEENVL